MLAITLINPLRQVLLRYALPRHNGLTLLLLLQSGDATRQLLDLGLQLLRGLFVLLRMSNDEKSHLLQGSNLALL